MHPLGPVARPDPVGRTPAPLGREPRLAGPLPVVGEEAGALVELVPMELLDGARQRRVHARPALAQLRPIGDLLRQRVLEGVLDLRIRRLLVQELGRHERLHGGSELGRRQLGDPPEQRLGQLPADHGGRLEHRLLPLRQPIDARCQHGVHGRRDRELLHGPHEAVGPLRAGQTSRLDQRLHHLLDEERVAARALADAVRQGHDGRIGAEEIAQQLGERAGAERL